MKDYVEFIAKSLVDKPEEVEVREVEDRGGAILELKVAREDLGKIIGRQGKTARALRLLVGAAAIRARKRIILEILE